MIGWGSYHLRQGCRMLSTGWGRGDLSFELAGLVVLGDPV